MMFSNNYYPIHIEVLNGLLCSLKYERFKLTSESTTPYIAGYGKEIEASLMVPVRARFIIIYLQLVTKEMEIILGKYYVYKDESVMYPLNEVI